MDNVNKYLPAAVLAAAMLFFAYDIIVDVVSGGDSYLHIVIEFAVFLAISYVLFRELLHVKALNTEIRAEKSKTARLAGELFSVIRSQFEQWELSPSESEVAMLLIKGFSMKEIAELRNVKEKTVRLQATKIYSKSGYSGRHELAAHFIEDLMSEV
ncbi:LuxR C-terminal-related transcriptional regulator [uncultured Paraglaciecola sp.]|uniref:helix-turn-helix transcriptional regulator n=1 Tax=uncultured Paraglaciecola sp. TaxID=1765024 RepID=UPI002636A4F4|nr:LuxR C-terminal-related transcriptional regulator [uncultured Paraglaciecola sp.]